MVDCKDRSSACMWTLWGGLFGLCFPVMASVIRLVQYGPEETIKIVANDPLMWIIFTAPVFLGFFAFLGGRQNDQVKEFSESLEQKVEQRTAELNVAMEELNVQATNQKNLLAGFDEGVFYFDRTGKIAQERSPALTAILPGADQQTDICSFFEQYGETTREAAKEILSYLWDDESLCPFNDIAAMLAGEVSFRTEDARKIVHFHYKDQRDENGRLERVIVFVKDITAQRAAEESQRFQTERIKRVSMAAADTESFKQFHQEADLFFDKIDQTLRSKQALDLPVLKRELHTLKGNTATFEFATLASRIHEVEDLLSQIGDEVPPAFLKKWQAIQEQWQFETTDIAEVLGLSKADRYKRVDRDKYEELRQAVGRGDLGGARRWTDLLERYPAAEVMGKYERLTVSLASRISKAVKVEFATDCAEVSYAELALVDEALIHIFRNFIDHGIEDSDAREVLGKPREGRINVSVKRDARGLRLRLKDDGAGIDIEKVAKLARQRGVRPAAWFDSAEASDIIRLIFEPSFSTADEVTETSGRGVGMDAVKKSLENLGGEIHVFSEEGAGSLFDIFVPHAAQVKAAA